MGIVMQVVEIATASIPDSMKNARVERVNLKVGRLSAVVPSSLRFCFEIITKDTALAGAELRIQEIPVVARCREVAYGLNMSPAVMKSFTPMLNLDSINSF